MSAGAIQKEKGKKLAAQVLPLRGLFQSLIPAAPEFPVHVGGGFRK